MASILDTIATQIAAGFKGKLSNGLLRREVVSVLNPLGDPVAPTWLTFAVQGIQDNFSAYYAASAGIPLTDVRVLIISNLIVPITDVRQDDYIFIRPVNAVTGNWLQVRRVLAIDPAVATYTLQCFKIEDPTILQLLVLSGAVVLPV